MFEGVLKEEKIIFKSRQKSLLSIACETLCALLYPFQWHHVYIPVLPLSLLDFLQSPTPYIVGVDTDHLAGASWDVESAEGVSYSQLPTPASRSHSLIHFMHSPLLTLILTRTLSRSIFSLTYSYILTLFTHLHSHSPLTRSHTHTLSLILTLSLSQISDYINRSRYGGDHPAHVIGAKGKRHSAFPQGGTHSESSKGALSPIGSDGQGIPSILRVDVMGEPREAFRTPAASRPTERGTIYHYNTLNTLTLTTATSLSKDSKSRINYHNNYNTFK